MGRDQGVQNRHKSVLTITSPFIIKVGKITLRIKIRLQFDSSNQTQKMKSQEDMKSMNKHSIGMSSLRRHDPRPDRIKKKLYTEKEMRRT